jgi:hypothetical protein
MSIVLLAKPRAAQPLNKFPAFYGTRKFITVLTRSPVSVLTQMIPVHTCVLFNVHFNTLYA